MPTQNGTISASLAVQNRKQSEKDGLVVNLCHSCHNEPPNGVHFNKKRMQKLHEYGQMKWELNHIGRDMTAEETRKAFIKLYGKNYL